jgi:hypothetical protein
MNKIEEYFKIFKTRTLCPCMCLSKKINANLIDKQKYIWNY